MLTREDAAIIGAYTGICCGPFSDMHEFVEKILGHPVMTHEFAQPAMWEKIKEAATPYFMKICPDMSGE